MTQITEPLFPQPTMSPSFQHHSSPLPLRAPDNMVWATIPSPVHHENMMSGVEQVRFCLLRTPSSPETDSYQTACLPRGYTGNDGVKHTVGIQSLPEPIRLGFRNTYIRNIIKHVCASSTPWATPSLDFFQQEFNTAYPSYHVRLHLDDAAVAPVWIFPSAALSMATYPAIHRLSEISAFYAVTLEKKP